VKNAGSGVVDQRSRITFVAKDPPAELPVPGSADDPRCNGDPQGTTRAALHFASATSGSAHSAELPCHNWKLIGAEAAPKGYRYRDRKGREGTVRSVVWKPGRQLKLELSGKGAPFLGFALEPGVAQGTLTAALRSGELRLCAACAAADARQDGSDGRRFTGTLCPAPVACAP
jgi:hypothetical protein